ncbi:DUF917 domain-containing protein [Pseudoalteromonas sp. SG43-5]|uniref:DUF917 domain-containing protein n=1 Tax=Pseudoalteromonas sp. SG43-5 TaxID=2760968 RepID=UPI0015FF10F6|nr:DUF917 domain-containing protein [Pseudoalteromonas sp. SG43-5]MBB1453747.1 DUF917 domain-containing protein [Pseudoalteromonas sp. SG43-5]
MQILNREQLIDILYGCAILGTGGGGELSEGINYIDEALALGKTFKLISADEVPAGELVCTPYILGAISPLTDTEERAYANLPRTGKHSILAAYDRALEYMNKESIYGTICCELGGANTAVSFYLAAMFDGYIIDADPAGRAVPEITHSTYYLNNLPAAPIITANEFGECFICENVMDDLRAETVVRALAKISRNDIAAIDHILPIEQMKDAVIHGTISKALKLGRAMREANNSNENTINVVAEQGKGFVAFEGVVSEFEFKTLEGFTIGEVMLAGTGEFAGNSYKITVKNENMAAFLNGEVHVTIPDLICCLNTQAGTPITNPNYEIGMPVSVIILPAPVEFTTPKGLSIFGPNYAGVKSDYRPAIKS